MGGGGGFSSESARPIPVWLGIDSRTQHDMWVEFNAGSHPQNSNATQKQWMKNQYVEVPMQNPISLFVFVVVYLWKGCRWISVNEQLM